ncbi:hypothetical protein MCOR25_004350 [Pyricularia grisea]|nr:hypothetical protein MCOR25_004350 [Pyricularia grisea]
MFDQDVVTPRVFFMRYGETEWAKSGRFTGTTDIEFTEDGIKQGQYEVTATEEIAEWNYGRYEGLKEEEIRSLRKERGLDLDREWNIWRDGCEGGESKDAITERLDKLISRIKSFQRLYMGGRTWSHSTLLLSALDWF